MSLDLFQDQNERRLSEMPTTTEIESGVWDGFLPGSSQIAMRTFAEAGRSASLAASVAPIVYDKFAGGTEMQDRYFKFHDEVFGEAVKFWTPQPNTVGAAGEVAGMLLGTLPLVIASPAMAVAKTQLTAAEDLTRMGVDTSKAQTVAGVQAAGFGLGVWLPILGGSLATRTLAGGAGANVALGVSERAISGEILEDTPAESMYKGFDPKMITLDVLLGLAFGTLAHVSPQQRAQGEAFWKRMQEWGSKSTPENIDALAVLRQAQHMDADSLHGKPADFDAVGAHHERMTKAVNQLLRDEQVRVDDLPEARIDPDKTRLAENKARFNELRSQADRVRSDENIIDMPEIKAIPAEPIVAKTDPLTDAAVRFAEDNSELRIPIGKDDQGQDITQTPKELLQRADDGLKAAEGNAKLFRTAAACLMGLL